MAEKRIIAIDIDGVILDYFGPFSQFLNGKLARSLTMNDITHYWLSEVYGVSKEMIMVLGDEFNSFTRTVDLPVIDNAIERLRRIMRCWGVVIITSRYDAIEAETRRYFSQCLPGVKMYFSSNYFYGKIGKPKIQIAYEIGAHCLIDDNPFEFEEWDYSFGVLPICFRQPWNHSVSKNIPRFSWPAIEESLLYGQFITSR